METQAPRQYPQFPRPLRAALAWLAATPATDSLRDLSPLRKHLAALAKIGLPPLSYLKLLAMFQDRADLVASALKPLLLDVTLPVEKQLRTVAIGLASVHEALASGYLQCLRSVPTEQWPKQERSEADVAAAGLANLSQQYEIAHFVCATLPGDFWTRACASFGAAGAGPTPAADAAQLQMKVLLALAAAQPEAFAPREISFLASYLRTQAAVVEIRPAPAMHCPDDFWVDAQHGKHPAACARVPPPHDTALFYSCAALSRIAGQHLCRIEQGEHPAAMGLPQEAIFTDSRHVLAEASARWGKPRKRQNPRRSHGDRVQLCTRVETLWRSDKNADAATISEWMIVNEGPGGCAVMHVAGKLAGIIVGSAIGLRQAAELPWSLCIVRWTQSENPEHLELGLELLAPYAEPVHIARRDAAAAQSPALLLPPLPALNRGEALLLATGSFTPGRFTLIDAGKGRVRVAECSSGNLIMHTTCVELFEFVRDFF